MHISLAEFFPKYPDIEDSVLNPYSKDFNEVIYNKKEFNELKLDRAEDKPADGGLYKHQQVISRFLSSHTPYTGLLLLHDMGTGKTCSLFGATEQIKREGVFKRAFIMTRNPRLLKNLKHELAYVCTQNVYSPEEQGLTDQEKIQRINKSTSVFYSFVSFDAIKKTLKVLTDAQIIAMYSNSVFGIDEVHNLKLYGEGTNSSSEDYNQIHRLLHVAKNIKVLLMSGTPMTDHPSEIAHMLNLILPLEKQLPTGKNFTDRFIYTENGISYIRNEEKAFLKGIMKGRVSYLKPMMSDVEVSYEGSVYAGLQLFKVDPSKMGDVQATAYKVALKKDSALGATDDVHSDDEDDVEGDAKKSRTAGVYSNSRQATLFVFPDGSYGSTGFRKYVRKLETKRVGGKGKKISYKLTDEFKKELKGCTNAETIANIRRYGATYADTIASILANRHTLHFIYGKLIEGSGNILFGCLLELVGYTHGSIGDTRARLTYFNVTKKLYSDDQIKAILNYYSACKNKNGAMSNVLISSKILAEGFTIKNVQRIHVLTPHWNFSELAQAIARGIRLNAHNDLIADGQKPHIKIFLHVAIAEGVKSLDLDKYIISERKDVAMKDVERLIKEAAFDCALFRDRNMTPNLKDYSRECEYKRCEYQCDGITTYEITQDYTTYNLYYSEKQVDDVIHNIKLFFNTQFATKVDHMLELYKGLGFETFTILKAISTMIDRNHEIRNRYNIVCYLREENNVLFIIDNISYSAVFSQCSYTKFLAVKDSMTYDEAFNDMCLAEIRRRPANAGKYLDVLAPILKKYMCEEVIDRKLDSELADIVRCHFDINRNNYTIDGNVYRVGGEIVETVKAPSPVREQIVEAEHGYSGKYNDEFFCIKKHEEVTDTRAKPTGRTCPSSWRVEQLCRIVVELKIPYENASQKFTNIKTMSKAAVLAGLEDTKLSSHMAEFSVLELEDLRRVLYFASSSKQLNCDAIRKYFTDNGLLVRDETCGNPGVKRTKE